MTSIDDVAREAGVSTATVSRALSGRGPVAESTRRRVQAVAERLSYVASPTASGLATGRTLTIGVVVPHINRWYFSTVLDGVQSALLAHGYDLVLYDFNGDARQRKTVFDNFLLRKRLDAIIAINTEFTPEELDLVLGTHKPTVGIGGPQPGLRTLSIDDRAVAQLATEHLLSLGHTRIAHLGGDVDAELDFHVPSLRLAGYRDALLAAGIEPQQDWYQRCDYSMRDGYRAAQAVLADPRTRPTAIFAASDEMAFGAMVAAQELGISVPYELSIIGVDGHDMGEVFALTTVAQHPELQGAAAVELLMEELKPRSDRDAPVNLIFPYDLIVRRSTTKPRRDQ